MHQVQKLGLTFAGEIFFKFRALVEMIFNGSLVAPRDENHVGGACGRRFFHGVLDEGLIHHRQHFLGHGLCGRQKTRAETGHGKDNFTDGFHRNFSHKKDSASDKEAPAESGFS